jgi:RNA polymerase sigma-70 factor (ECF subfamily)
MSREDAFERLYSEHAAPLLRFLTYRTGDRSLSEDVLADTFERVLTARKGFDRRKASEKTWLYTIALNCLRDHVRRIGAESRALERVALYAGGGQNAPYDDLAERDRIHRALAGLSDDERECIALRYGADLKLEEIADLVGEPRTTVEGRVYRGLKRLRDELS